MNIVDIAIDSIEEDKDQPRYQFTEESLQELADSIAELGLLSPIKVRKTDGGRYKIIYGNRRYKACVRLGKKTISCIVSEATDELEIYLEQVAENLTREGFSPIEEAEAFDKLLNNPAFSSSVKFLAAKLGKPEAYIKAKCELLKFSPQVRRLIVHGTDIRKDALTEDQAKPLAALPIDYRDSLALIAARDELPVNDVKKIAKLFKDPGISDSTKSKLLYKSGYELLETWSTFEHNRKEREKAAATAAAAAEAKAAKAETASEVQHAGQVGHAEQETTGRGATDIAEGKQARAGSAAGLPYSNAFANMNVSATITKSRFERLARLRSALPSPLSPGELLALDREELILPESDKARLLADADTVIANLENHLAEWRKIRELAAATKSHA